MKRFPDNVRPLNVLHAARAHRYPIARVIKLGHHHHEDRIGPAIAFALLAITAWVLMAALLVVFARSGGDAFGRFVPGWLWW